MGGLECSECNKTFGSEKSLEQHMQDRHKQAAVEEACEECETPMQSGKSLRLISREILGIFFGQNSRQSVEREMIKLALMTFGVLLVLAGIGYWGFLLNNPNFLPRFGLLLLYLMIGGVANSAVIWHLRAYKNVSCQTGMMIGMTTGMLSGFTVGLIIGVSNGIFVGAVVGLVFGFLLGGWAGKCCGIMGVLEGQMAGFMAGPMGAMTAIMMVNDNYLWFIALALFFEIVIFAGLMFLVYKENAGQGLNIVKKTAKQDFFPFLAVNFIILLFLAWLMLYGPKSALIRIVLS